MKGEHATCRLKHHLVIGSSLQREKLGKRVGNQIHLVPATRYSPSFVLFNPRGLIRTSSTIRDCGHQIRRDPRLIHRDVHHEPAMIGEGVLWKCVGVEGTSRWGELDSFAQMVSEISRTSVAACRGGSFHLGRRVKVV